MDGRDLNVIGNLRRPTLSQLLALLEPNNAQVYASALRGKSCVPTLHH